MAATLGGLTISNYLTNLLKLRGAKDFGMLTCRNEVLSRPLSAIDVVVTVVSIVGLLKRRSIKMKDIYKGAIEWNYEKDAPQFFIDAIYASVVEPACTGKHRAIVPPSYNAIGIWVCLTCSHMAASQLCHEGRFKKAV